MPGLKDLACIICGFNLIADYVFQVLFEHMLSSGYFFVKPAEKLSLANFIVHDILVFLQIADLRQISQDSFVVSQYGGYSVSPAIFSWYQVAFQDLVNVIKLSCVLLRDLASAVK